MSVEKLDGELLGLIPALGVNTSNNVLVLKSGRDFDHNDCLYRVVVHGCSCDSGSKLVVILTIIVRNCWVLPRAFATIYAL